MTRAPDHRAHYLAFCIHVRELCHAHDASVISWWRTEKRNAALKGHPRSFHLEGLAADLAPDDRAQLVALERDAKRRGLQVTRKRTVLHVELDYRNP